jgi:putative redox protein
MTRTRLDGAGDSVNVKPMSVTISVDYLGELRCRTMHGPSQVSFLTDAPVDNMGKGESFSPTDLVATALGTCIATTMGIYAQRHGIDLRGMRVSVVKEMTSVPLRRIAKLTTEVRAPLATSHPQRETLERVAHTCPVHQSLHPEVEKPIAFIWEDPT